VTCPACGHALSTKTVGDLTVDVCAGGCGGIWFDNQELQKVDNSSETLGDQLLDIPVDPHVQVDQTQRYHCPKCEARPIMMRHFESVKRRATVDQCPSCNGYWLDAGELRTIRGEYETQAARDTEADAYFGDLFGAQLSEEHASGEAGLATGRQFQHRFRFLFPSSTRY
jgi:Zn-finger nucleic acid-binding protein